MGLYLRSSSLANPGNAILIAPTALTYDQADGNFMYLLTNLSGSNINITGSTSILGTLTVTGNTTGNLIGTSSWATNSVSASRAISSSWAPNVYNSNGILTGNRIINQNNNNLGFENAAEFYVLASEAVYMESLGSDGFSYTNIDGGYTEINVSSQSFSNAGIIILQPPVTNGNTNIPIQIQAISGSSTTFYKQYIDRIELDGNTYITGSLTISGSSTLKNIGTTSLTGSLNVTGSTTQIGNNTLIGNTVLSGSIVVSGSSDFKNSVFIVTGSTYFKGFHEVSGSTNITGSLNVIGDLNVTSGSSFLRWGNRLFNYAQFANTSSINVTQNVSGAFNLPYIYPSSVEGISIVSGSRITFNHSGLYNIQFSTLVNQGVGTANMHIWFKKTGSNIDNSDTAFIQPNNTQDVRTWNFLCPFSASEYAEIWYHSNAANTSFSYGAAGSGFPASPSIIVTVTQVA